jgi:hypothetical protein
VLDVYIPTITGDLTIYRNYTEPNSGYHGYNRAILSAGRLWIKPTDGVFSMDTNQVDLPRPLPDWTLIFFDANVGFGMFAIIGAITIAVTLVGSFLLNKKPR